MHDRLARFIHTNENFDGSVGQAIQLASRIARSSWLANVIAEAKADALKEYADLLEGSTYTLNFSSADHLHAQIVGLLRRDAELIYRPFAVVGSTPEGQKDA